jgi:SAM-dependent methyltransferase
VPAGAVEGADALEREGLLTRDGDRVVARLRITAWNRRLLAQDVTDGSVRADVVPGPGEASQTLASLTVRRPGQTVLDLGCGCGPQTLLAAVHADRVVATDLNPHAAELTALSARLNGAGVVETRVGDSYEPVAGERFDLLVANPPFVISPDTDLLYRDSGLGPGELCRRIVAGAGEHLEEGGMASILCSWGGGSPDTLREWLAGSGCDALAISYGPQDVVDYAAHWTQLTTAASGADAQAEAIARWLRFYEAAGIEAIWFAALVLRRRTGAANWFTVIDAARPAKGSGSPQLERIFAAQELTGDALIDAPLVPAAHHRLVHTLGWRGEGYGVGDIRLVLEDDVGIDGPVDAPAVDVLLALDGRPARAVIAAVAAARGVGEGELAAAVLPSLQRLYRRGFLVRTA